MSGRTRYARRVQMEANQANGFNLNIFRYISTAVANEKIDLRTVNVEMLSLEQKITETKGKCHVFLKELRLPPLA